VNLNTIRADMILPWVERGEEVFDVSQKLPVCGKRAPIFDSAEILLGRRSRFAEAKIIHMPRIGCIDCELRVVTTGSRREGWTISCIFTAALSMVSVKLGCEDDSLFVSAVRNAFEGSVN